MKPHKAAASSTLPGWILKILGLSGIGTNMISAYSTISVSISIAERPELSVPEILKRGSYSKKTAKIFKTLKLYNEKALKNFKMQFSSNRFQKRKVNSGAWSFLNFLTAWSLCRDDSSRI